MASDKLPYFLVIFIVLFIKKTEETLNIFDENDKLDMTSHLKLEIVQKYCLHRDEACKSNITSVCGGKMKNGKMFYKDFQNDCYLFLSNMCDYPGEEFFFVSETSCSRHLTKRRSNEVENETNSTSAENSTTAMIAGNKATKVPVLRDNDEEDSAETSFDNHVCPYSCPNTYVPECLSVNQMHGGKYFRMFFFINHCQADDYYCKHWKEFPEPPDTETEDVASSPISWTKCASSRFIQFSRFAEAASSMGHYGWLAGPYRASHIMEPHERIPGFG